MVKRKVTMVVGVAAISAARYPSLWPTRAMRGHRRPPERRPGRGDCRQDIHAGVGAATAYTANIASSTEINQDVDDTVAELGRMGVPVNCAATREYYSMLDFTDETWQRVLETSGGHSLASVSVPLTAPRVH